MNKFQPLRQLICEDCGTKFFGLYNKYCTSCMRKRKQYKLGDKK